MLAMFLNRADQEDVFSSLSSSLYLNIDVIRKKLMHRKDVVSDVFVSK